MVSERAVFLFSKETTMYGPIGMDGLSPRLQLALEACRALGVTSSGEVCFRWISPEYKAKGVIPQDLMQLARFGRLQRSDQNKRGAYYRLVGYA